MANQNANATISEQVRQHGEMLARLTVIVEQDHEDLGEVKKALGIIAKAVARQETTEISRESVRAKVLMVVIPFATTLLGLLAGHFWFH